MQRNKIRGVSVILLAQIKTAVKGSLTFTKSLQTHVDNNVVLSMWFPGSTSNLATSLGASPNANG